MESASQKIEIRQQARDLAASLRLLIQDIEAGKDVAIAAAVLVDGCPRTMICYSTDYSVSLGLLATLRLTENEVINDFNPSAHENIKGA